MLYGRNGRYVTGAAGLGGTKRFSNFPELVTYHQSSIAPIPSAQIQRREFKNSREVSREIP